MSCLVDNGTGKHGNGGNGNGGDGNGGNGDAVVEIFEADFSRIWIVRPADLCESGCFHAKLSSGPHACRDRERCLHLMTSSGRYTHVDGEKHRRVPLGSYKIGRVATGEDTRFLTNDVAHDALIHDREWAVRLGLVSFAGYRVLDAGGEPLGVLALFARHPISSTEDALLAPWRERWAAQGLGHVLRVPTHVGALGTAEDLMAVRRRVSLDGARTRIHATQEEAS